jgi:hypothetical protein
MRVDQGYLSHYSSVLWAGWPGFDSRQRQEICFLHSVKTGSGASAAFYPVGTMGFSLEVKQPRRGTDHSPPSSAKVKNGGDIPALLHTS